LRRKRRGLAKERYKKKIISLAQERGAVKLDDVSRLICTGKTYAWKLLQELVKEGVLEQVGYGLYLVRRG